MSYKITERVADLVQSLIEAGYGGEVTMTNSYPTATRAFLEESFSLQLTGFCKECLYVSENTETGDIVCVGRYSLELEKSGMEVSDIVDIAWSMYKTYKGYSNYGMPEEFKSLFISNGYLKEKKVVETILEEAK